jgi:hypothetical protein
MKGGSSASVGYYQYIDDSVIAQYTSNIFTWISPPSGKQVVIYVPASTNSERRGFLLLSISAPYNGNLVGHRLDIKGAEFRPIRRGCQLRQPYNIFSPNLRYVRRASHSTTQWSLLPEQGYTAGCSLWLSITTGV